MSTEHIPFGTQPDPRPGPADDIGWWLSAALEDPNVAPEMKSAINKWFEAGQVGECRYCANTGWFYGDPDLKSICSCAFGKLREELTQSTAASMHGEFHPPTEPAKPVVWSLPPIDDRPDSFQCLVWWQGRWRHVAWAKAHTMWMFGYGTPGIGNELGLMFAPLPHEMDGDFWNPQVRRS